MKKIKSILSVLAFFSLFFAGCSMDIDTGSSTPVSSIRKIEQVRSIADTMTYMGGSLIYNPGNTAASHILKGVTIGMRLGQLEKNYVEGGNYITQQSDTDFMLGYIKVTDVTMESITIEWYVYPDDETIEKANFMESFTIPANHAADINRDGYQDIAFRTPDPGTVGYKTNMWLSFLNNGETSCLYSSIPDQYTRSVYPRGIVGVNPDGHSIGMLYENGTNNRAIFSELSYGDYIIDNERNDIFMYKGKTIADKTGKSSRSVSDDELTDVVISDRTINDVLYRLEEFGQGYDPVRLLEALPKSLVTKEVSSMSNEEAVNYLNEIIQRRDFANLLAAGYPGEAADAVTKFCASRSIASDIDVVRVNRAAIKDILKDYAPTENDKAKTYAYIYDSLYIRFSASPAALYKGEGASLKNFNFLQLSSKKINPISPKDKATYSYSKEFLEYAEHRDEVLTAWSNLLVYDFLDTKTKRFLNSKTSDGKKRFEGETEKSAVKGAIGAFNPALQIGIAGVFAISDKNFYSSFTIGAMAKIEVNETFSMNIKKGSLFSEDTYGLSEEEIKDNKKRAKEFEDGFFKSLDEGVSKKYMNDKWSEVSYLGGKQKIDLAMTNAAKKTEPLTIPICSVPPIEINIDGAFDILYSASVYAQMKNFYGGFFIVAGGKVWSSASYAIRSKLDTGNKVIDTISWFIPGWNIVKVADRAINTIKDAKFDAGFVPFFEKDGFFGLKTTSWNDVLVGGGGEFGITPVVELNAHVDFGHTVKISDLSIGGDVGPGVKLSIGLPVKTKFGLFVNLGEDGKYRDDVTYVDDKGKYSTDVTDVLIDDKDKFRKISSRIKFMVEANVNGIIRIGGNIRAKVNVPLVNEIKREWTFVEGDILNGNLLKVSVDNFDGPITYKASWYAE